MEIASAEACMSQRREQLQPGWKMLFFIECHEMLGCREGHEKEKV